MKPIDLYLKDLVPMAQAMMLLGELYNQLTTRNMKMAHKREMANGARLDRAEIRAQFLGEGFNTLNLVNCEVQSWTSAVPDQDARLLRISTELQPLKNRLVAEFESWKRLTGATGETLLKAALIQARLSTKKDFTGERIVDSLVLQLNTWGPAHTGVLTAIDYEHVQRHSWLRNRTRRNTPLMRDGRVGVWRTLANNCAWEPTFEMLKAPIAGFGQPRRFGSDIGKARLDDLMRIAFAPRAEPLFTTPTEPAEAPLPERVDIRRTPQGYIAVTAKHPRLTPGRATKSTADLTAFLQGNATFSVLLKAREQEFVCGPRMLPDAVDKAAAWLKEQDELEVRAREAFEAHRQGLVRLRVMARLKDFDGEELAILAGHFKSTAADAGESV